MSLAVAVCHGHSLFAHEPITTKITYSREISRIFAARCTNCHAPGGKAPMSLATYAEVRPWAVAIKERVFDRSMPPWGAVKGFGAFNPDLGLSQEEITLITSWALGGAPEGDPSLLPPTPRAAITPPPSEYGTPLAVRGDLTLSRSVTLLALRPAGAAPIDSERLIARKPDGVTVPLIWLYRYRPGWRNTFVLRNAVPLPAGTHIESTSASAAWELLIARVPAQAR